MSFWRLQKDKSSLVGVRNVLFGGFKRPKAAWVVFEMSFRRVQRDKRNPGSDRNVLLEVSKRQK
ncbi:hypothetical protein DXF96_07645 [Heyndrickxia coagulans]|nr:hypothetical protein CYJ15_02080 [Heyndrickxia coagulans]QDI61369.1 hypothetical protein DXF96_07645 [Heyndrickxia coagulans]